MWTCLTVQREDWDLDTSRSNETPLGPLGGSVGRISLTLSIGQPSVGLSPPPIYPVSCSVTRGAEVSERQRLLDLLRMIPGTWKLMDTMYNSGCVLMDVGALGGGCSLFSYKPVWSTARSIDLREETCLLMHRVGWLQTNSA